MGFVSRRTIVCGLLVGVCFQALMALSPTGLAEPIWSSAPSHLWGTSWSAISAPGDQISVQGSGFLPTDTTCTISSPSSPNLIQPGTAACVIRMGTGIAVGGFIIGNVLPGSYVVQLTGNQGDFAQAILVVE